MSGLYLAAAAIAVVALLPSYLLARVMMKPAVPDGPWLRSMKQQGIDEQTDPGSRFDLQFEDVEISLACGSRLRAWYVPVPGSSRAVITIHGGRNDRRALMDYVPAMHAEGLSVLLVDLRNHGHSDLVPPGLTLGVQESEDVEAWAEWLSSSHGVTSIGLVGISLGAASALLSAARIPQVKALMLQSTGYNIAGVFERAFSWVPGFIATNASRMVLLRSGVSIIDALATRYPHLQAATTVKQHVMFIHGGQDPIASVEEVKELYDRVPGRKDFCLIDDMGHELALYQDNDKYTALVAGFFNEHLPSA